MVNKRWAINLPYKIIETFVCDLIGHKPALDLQFIPGLTKCQRCFDTIKLDNGIWRSDMAIIDVIPTVPNCVAGNIHTDLYVYRRISHRGEECE